MAEYVECEVHLLIDEAGEYVVSNTPEDLSDLYIGSVGRVPANCRTIALKLAVPLPVGVTASAEIPEDAQPGYELTVTVAA